VSLHPHHGPRAPDLRQSQVGVACQGARVVLHPGRECGSDSLRRLGAVCRDYFVGGTERPAAIALCFLLLLAHLSGGSIGVALLCATVTGFAWHPFLLYCWPAHPPWRPCYAGTGTRAARAVSERHHGESGQGRHAREGRFDLLPFLLALAFGGTMVYVLSPVPAPFR